MNIPWTTRLHRALDRFFESVGLRPVGLLGFGASVLAFVGLMGASSASFRSDAVAVAGWVDHPAMAASFVTEVLVKPGDWVEVSTPLVRLSPHFIDQRIARLDSQIEEVRNEAKLAQVEIQIAEQSWVQTGARVRPNRPSLRGPTAALFRKQIEVFETRRQAMLDDRESLLVQSRTQGVVASVLPMGGAVEEGGSVASITPSYADEIVAYVPAATAPDSIAPGASAQIVAAVDSACLASAQVLRRGAAVLPTPPQIQGFLPFQRHGLPVHISVPATCRLSVGQVIAVEFDSEGSQG